MKNKYNDNNLFSGKQVIFFFLIAILFLSLLVGFTVKFGLQGYKDIEEQEELLKEAKKWTLTLPGEV